MTTPVAQKVTVFINAVRHEIKQTVLNAENSQIAANAVTAAAITIDVGVDE